MNRLLRISPRLEAVFVACDWMALGAMRAIRERGLRIPQDIAVVGFDDVPLAAQTDPPLTTVRQPMTEMGRMGVRLLAQLIRKQESGLQKAVLPTELVVRLEDLPIGTVKERHGLGLGRA
ncbi:MAG: substrate-binding domain-containing protein [Candidatus Bipolaricaulaceae bacterium]